MQRTSTETALGESRTAWAAWCLLSKSGVRVVEKNTWCLNKGKGIFLLPHRSFPGELSNEMQGLSIWCELHCHNFPQFFVFSKRENLKMVPVTKTVRMFLFTPLSSVMLPFYFIIREGKETQWRKWPDEWFNAWVDDSHERLPVAETTLSLVSQLESKQAEQPPLGG